MKRFMGLAALLATTSAFGITGNWIEDTEHPYVGLIALYKADGTFLQRCSGSLISPTKFVTAGHCVDAAAGVVSARVYFQQGAGANFNPSSTVKPSRISAPASAAASTSNLSRKVRRGQYATGASVVPGAPESVTGPKSYV